MWITLRSRNNSQLCSELCGTNQNKINPQINRNIVKCISGSWALCVINNICYMLLLLLLLFEITPKWKLANSPCRVFFGDFLKEPAVLVFQYYLCFLAISHWMQARGTKNPVLKFGCTITLSLWNVWLTVLEGNWQKSNLAFQIRK